MKQILPIFALLAISSMCCSAQTKEEIDTFAAAVSEACSTKDIKRIEKLYDFSDTPEILVDQAIGRWEEQFSDSTRMQGEFAGVEFKKLEEYRNNPNVNQLGIDLMVEGKVMNRTLYKPNLPIVGMISVKFKHEDGSWSALLPIGLTEDGKLRFSGTNRIKND